MELISRKDAAERDLKYYFTGVPCSKGHISIRYVSTFSCVECFGVTTPHVPKDIDFTSFTSPPDGMVISRFEAISSGYRHYYTGKSCIRGHYSRRDVRTWECLACSKEDDQKKRLRKKTAERRQLAERYGRPILSKAEAERLGEGHYFTGKACVKGHLSERRTSNGYCVVCFPNNRKPSTSPEEIRTRARDRVYWRKYKITLDQYDSLLSHQGGVCSICSEECESGNRLVVDHDHVTGAVRGLLCRKCNLGIGHLRDSVDLLTKATQYLSSHYVS
jgi:hypothetical protein